MRTFKRIKNGRHIDKLLMEYYSLSEKQRKLPLVKLDQPYFKNWKVIPILREDVQRRKDVDRLKTVLKFGYSTHIIHDVNAVRAIRKGIYTFIVRRYDYKKKKYFFDEGSHVHRKKINQETFKKLSPLIQKYFYQIEDKNRIYYRCSFPKYYVKLKVRKHLVCYERIVDPLLDSRLHELENYLIKHNYIHLLYNSYYNYWNYYDYYKFKLENEIAKCEINYLKENTKTSLMFDKNCFKL